MAGQFDRNRTRFAIGLRDHAFSDGPLGICGLGEVVAESRTTQLAAFFSHRFHEPFPLSVMPPPDRLRLPELQPGERQVLLACARPVWDDALAGQIEPLLSAVDWNRVLAAADRHRLLPLLHGHLSRSAAPLPRFVPEKLASSFRGALQRNLWLGAELVKLVHLLQENHIPTLPFKGPVLTEFLFGNLGLREITDLDILLRKEDVWRAKALLVSHGYEPEWNLTPTQEAVYFDSQCEYNLRDPKGSYMLELHWDIVPPHYPVTLDSQNWWRRQTVVNLLGTNLPSLSREDLLLVLCVHGAKHAWSPLRLVSDLAALLRTYPVAAWDTVFHEARAAGAERILLLGLGLAHDLLESSLPGEPQQRLASNAAVGTLRRGVAGSVWTVSPDHGMWSVLVFRFHLWDTLPLRLQFLLRSALNPAPEDLATPLPAPLRPLYGLIRLGRLVVTLLVSLWQRLVGRTPRTHLG